jgi:MSHA pilin protein MshA
MEKKKKLLRNENGFTLIEIIAILILLAALAAAVIPKYFDMQEEARQKSAEGTIAEMKVRLINEYGEYLLENNGNKPSTASVISDEVSTDLGEDYTVALSASDMVVTITVSAVEGVALTSNVRDTWVVPGI